nr:recombinase family protein [uncultured Aminipila sp.]
MKVAIYCRLSEEDRNKHTENDDSESIQNQKSMLVQHAVEQNWEIYRIYSDDDYTGADRTRPEFRKLLFDAEQHKFDIVLCKTQSRFTRELELVEKYIHGLFPVWGIRFVSIVDNADTQNKGNKKSRQINGLVNEWYLEDMSDNIKSVLIDKRKKGIHIGAFALYGYKKNPEQKGKLIIDEEAAEVVREVFILFSQGYGKSAIARILNDRDIPNPTEYKRLKGLRYKQPESKNSTLWKYYAIADMLVNEIYIGNMVQGKYGSVSYKSKKNKPRPKEEWYVVEGTHEPIIDRELWNKVQDIINQKVKPFTSGKIGLFARKVKCSNCGYTLRSSKNHDRHYLKCSTRYVSKNACIGAFISVDKLEETVLAEINSMISIYIDKEHIEKNIDIGSGMIEKKMKLESAVKTYQDKIREYTKAANELYLDKVKKLITIDQYMEFSQNFYDEKNKMLQLLQETRHEINNIADKLQSEDDKRQLIECYTNLKKLDRIIVEQLIDCIYIGKKDTKTGVVSVEIHWNF